MQKVYAGMYSIRLSAILTGKDAHKVFMSPRFGAYRDLSEKEPLRIQG